MSKADELIAGLQSAAEFESEGNFSLDREKARQKMRQFQLADPHRYVLLLVEAAALRGATRIDFEIDADDTHMRFDAALEWGDLDELYTSLFVDRSSLEIRARRELALACNAAMALNPRWIRIESWGGEPITGVRGILRPDEQDEIERIEQPPAEVRSPSTHIHVKDRFRPGLLVRFLHRLGDSLPEAELIRSRCALASIVITVNGDQISSGLPRDPIGAVEFEAEGLHGVAGLHDRERERSALVVLSNGVELSTTELGDSVPGLWFWVDSSQLRKDVSQADVVRSDPSYQAMLQAIAGARDGVLGRLVDLWAQGEFNRHPRWKADTIFDLLRRCFLRWADADWLRDDAGSLGKLADLPLWRTVDRRWLSPRMLAAEADPQRGIMYTHRDYKGVQPHGWGPVIHAFDGLAEVGAVQRVYPDARDVSIELEREVPWENNRRRWQSRPHEPTLPRGASSPGHLPPIDLAAGAIVGQVVARPEARTDIRIVVDGCLLYEIEFDAGVLGLSAVLAGPFEPTREFDRARPDRTLATAAMLLLAQIPVLLAQLAAVVDSPDVLRRNLLGEVIRKSLLSLVQPGFAGRWLGLFGFAARPAAELLERLGTPTLLPEFGLAGGSPAAIAHALTFRTADERTVSLLEIDAERRARAREPGKVLFVDTEALPSPPLDELIVRGKVMERWLLEAIFGREQVYDDTVVYRRDMGRRSFLSRPAATPRLRQADWQATLTGSIHGLVGIDAAEIRSWQGSDPRVARVDVIVEGRRLKTVEERSWVPGVSASVVWEDAPVNADWNDLEGPLQPLSAAVNQGVIAILETLAREALASNARPPADVRRLLWMSMATPFISTEHAAAWRRIRAEYEHATAVDVYFDLLVLFPTISLSDMRESITLLLEDQRVPTRKAVLEVLMRANPTASGGREFQRAMLERFELFERVPLIELCSGATISLAQLTDNFAATGEIAHVQDLGIRYETDEYVIVRADPIDHVALLRLFGREVFKEVSAWIHERRHQERFENQAPLTAIRVVDHQRLVGLEFDRDGITGELAIPPWHPGESQLMKLVFCHQRRVVQELELHAKQPVVGILDDPQAPLSTDFRSVDTKTSRMAVIRRLLDSLIDELLVALAEAYPKLDARQQSIARDWIFDHWRRASPRAGKHPNRLSAAGRKFAELKLFSDVDETPRSLAELSERYSQQRKIWIVESRPSHSVPPPFPILWCRTNERAVIEELFEDVEDFSMRWRARVDGAQRRLRATKLPDPKPPNNSIVSVEVDRHELKGALWLPDRVPFDAGVILGSGGRVLTVRDLVDGLPLQGVIDGVEADDRFQQPNLSMPVQRYLSARAISVYSELLNHHRRDLGRPDRPDFHEPGPVHHRRVRIELLRRAALALARARRQGESFDAILGRLEQRLAEEPLLELATGRLISVDVARKARPQELVFLGIWDPKQAQPEIDPVERARLLLGEPEPEAASEPAVEPTVEPSPQTASEPQTVSEPVVEELFAEIGLEEMSFSTFELDFLDAKGKVVPPPPEPKRDLIGELLERIREELRLLREQQQIVLSEGQLDGIAADRRNGRELVRIENGVVFDSAHPRFVRAMEDPDPIWVSFLASVAYTALNHWLDQITDEDELGFHHKHATHLLSGLLGVESAG